MARKMETWLIQTEEIRVGDLIQTVMTDRYGSQSEVLDVEVISVDPAAPGRHVSVLAKTPEEVGQPMFLSYKVGRAISVLRPAPKNTSEEILILRAGSGRAIQRITRDEDGNVIESEGMYAPVPLGTVVEYVGPNEDWKGKWAEVYEFVDVVSVCTYTLRAYFGGEALTLDNVSREHFKVGSGRVG